MKVTTSKSKNSESFYITQSYINSDGKSTSKRIRKLGTLKELAETLGTDRDGVMAWAREQARIETDKYKKDNEAKTVLIPFHASGSWITAARSVIRAATFSCSLFITGWDSTGSAGRSGSGTGSSMT